MLTSKAITEPVPGYRTVKIPSAMLRNYEMGAILLSEMAYPEPDADAERLAANHAICCAAIRHAARDKTWAWLEQPLRPAYLCQPQSDVQRTMQAVWRRLGQRLQAGLIGHVRLIQHLDPEHTPASLNKLAERLSDRGPEISAANLKARVLKPSWSVMHLSIAMDLYLREANGRRAFVDHLLHAIMFTDGFTARLVDDASHYAGWMQNEPYLRKFVPQLTRFSVG